MLPNIRTGILSFVWVVEMWLKSPSFLDFLGQWFPASKVSRGGCKLKLVKRWIESNENPSLCLFSRRYSLLGIYWVYIPNNCIYIYTVHVFCFFLCGRLGAFWLMRERGEGYEQSNLRKVKEVGHCRRYANSVVLKCNVYIYIYDLRLDFSLLWLTGTIFCSDIL